MASDINDAVGGYGVIGIDKKGAANGVAELGNDGKVPSSQLPTTSVPSPYTSTPEMDGTGSAGSSADYARGDHVHPTDTSRAPATALTDIFTTGSTNNSGGAIGAGVFFYKDGALVQAKTAIASGATLTLNTNYEVPTAGALNALKSAITKVETDLSNISGSGYCKMPDGTLLCWGEINVPISTYSQFGAMYSHAFSLNAYFAQLFIDVPYVSFTCNSASAGTIVNTLYDNEKITQIEVMRQNATGYYTTFRYLAVGRWKS